MEININKRHLKSILGSDYTKTKNINELFERIDFKIFIGSRFDYLSQTINFKSLKFNITLRDSYEHFWDQLY